MLWYTVRLLTKCTHVYRAAPWVLYISRYDVYLCLWLLQFINILMNHILWPWVTSKEDLKLDKSEVFKKRPEKWRGRFIHIFLLVQWLGCGAGIGLWAPGSCCGIFLTDITSYTSYALGGLRTENKLIFSSFTSHAQWKTFSPPMFLYYPLTARQLWYLTMCSLSTTCHPHAGHYSKAHIQQLPPSPEENKSKQFASPGGLSWVSLSLGTTTPLSLLELCKAEFLTFP